jgi:hypothetical protein
MIDPLLHHASDLDSDQLEIIRQLVLIAVCPDCFIGKAKGSPLDNPTAMRVVITFDTIFVTLEVIFAQFIIAHVFTFAVCRARPARSLLVAGNSSFVVGLIAEDIEDVLPIHMSIDATLDELDGASPRISECDRLVDGRTDWHSGIAHQHLDQNINYLIGQVLRIALVERGNIPDVVRDRHFAGSTFRSAATGSLPFSAV